jgi:hypothetical protein
MLAILAALALGQELIPITPPLDHRDQWGVILTPGLSLPTIIRTNEDYNPSVLPTLEVGASRAITDLSEVQLRVRLIDDPRLRPWILAGYRGYSTEGPFTTTYGADLAVVTGHDWGFGPRVSVGLQWDPVRWGGLCLILGFAATDGAALMLTFDGLLGGQLRF